LTQKEKLGRAARREGRRQRARRIGLDREKEGPPRRQEEGRGIREQGKGDSLFVQKQSQVGGVPVADPFIIATPRYLTSRQLNKQVKGWKVTGLLRVLRHKGCISHTDQTLLWYSSRSIPFPTPHLKLVAILFLRTLTQRVLQELVASLTRKKITAFQLS
jgi:hypothetical protein